MKTKRWGIAVIVIVSSLCWGWDQRQHQNQHQTVNSNNTVENSHNNTSESTATGGSSSNNYTSDYQEVHQTATAIGTTVFHSAPCVKSVGVGGQSGWAGLSLGGGKVDKNCRAMELAESLATKGKMLAYCKIVTRQPDAKDAGITIDDCMQSQPQAAIEPVSDDPPQIVIPASIPVVTFYTTTPVLASVDKLIPATPKPKRKAKPCRVGV